MAISEFEIFKVEKVAKTFCDNKNRGFPPDKLYIDYKLDGQSLYIFEVRLTWNDPNSKMEIMVAKLRFIKKEKLWKLYWQRQNMKWYLYENDSDGDLRALLTVINQDEYGCFWG